MVLVPLFGGERPPVFRVAWMLATIYVLAVLGYGVSAGGEVASPEELAAKLLQPAPRRVTVVAIAIAAVAVIAWRRA